MLDTVEFGWKIDGGLSDGMISDLARSCPEGLSGNLYAIGTEEARVNQYKGKIPRLGTIIANQDGSIVTGGSIIRRRQALDGIEEKLTSNEYLFSAAHCNQALQDIVSEYYKVLPSLRNQEFVMRRADICFQHEVKSSTDIIRAMDGAIKRTRQGRVLHDNGKGVDNGIFMKGNAVAFRAYDAGLQKHGRIDNKLRLEEQIRRKSVKMDKIFDAAQLIFNREACRETMNSRFVDTIYRSEKMERFRQLLRERKYQEACFVLEPEALEIAKEEISRSAYYRMAKVVREIRAECIPIELRLPEDAWMFDEEVRAA